MTHLLAKDAFRAELERVLAELASESSSTVETEDGRNPRLLAIMAMDIDFFKQVNDTWGHLYGDQVLKTFGLRLERVANGIRASGFGDPFVQVGHPSGEEFLAIVAANAPRDQFVRWANEFRTAIADDVLPSEKEWQWLIRHNDLSVLIPPPIQDRTVTTSIGVAMHSTNQSGDSGGDACNALLERADTALYRAKAAGRNQATFFDDILSTCGRVLEYDQATKVVAIDIGANVGVSVGQEFRVFPPFFTGHKKFSISDGRTTRTLGKYPRVELTRIVTFNTQPELAFAFVSAGDEADTPIAPGSHLEAIPAGSIGHLMPNSSRYFPPTDPARSSGISPIREYVKATAASTPGPYAVVLRFNRDADYVRKYGTAALNVVLAKLYRMTQTAFAGAHAVEVLDRGSVCVVGSNSAYKERVVSEFVDRVADDFPELGLLVGVFCDADRKVDKADEVKLDADHAIEYARFAASEPGRGLGSRVRHFGYATAIAVLQALRESNSLDVAYADFNRLLELGLESAALENLGGLIASASGNSEGAREHFESAMLLDPSGLIYKSNYGTACYRLGDVDSGLKVLNALSATQVEQLRVAHAYGYVTYARLLAYAKLQGLQTQNDARLQVIGPAALDLPDFRDSQPSKVIQQALEAKASSGEQTV